MRANLKCEISGVGTVFFATKPTKTDPAGCQGLYVRRVKLSKECQERLQKQLQAVIDRLTRRIHRVKIR